MRAPNLASSAGTPYSCRLRLAGRKGPTGSAEILDHLTAGVLSLHDPSALILESNRAELRRPNDVIPCE
jgi:hypothetical protein